MRRSLKFWTLAAAATIALAAGLLEIAIQPARMLHVVGLRGPFIWSGRVCRREPPYLDCSAAPPRYPLSLDVRGVTVSLSSALPADVRRVWTDTDSTRWARAVDSIRAAIPGHGGRARHCAVLDAERSRWAAIQARSGIEAPSADVWRFTGFNVRLFTNHFWVGTKRQPTWVVELHASRRDAPECSPPRTRRRLVTPGEWLDAESRALHERLGW